MANQDIDVYDHSKCMRICNNLTQNTYPIFNQTKRWTGEDANNPIIAHSQFTTNSLVIVFIL